MPLSDFKRIETGYYVVWTMYYRMPRQLNTFHSSLEKYDEIEGPFGYPHEPDFSCKRTAWHVSEEALQPIRRLMRRVVIPHETIYSCNKKARLEVKGEICIFEGGNFHTLGGKVWALQDIEHCISQFQAASDDEVLAIFGKTRRETRPRWQRWLFNLTCLSCCDSYACVSRRAS